MYLIEVFILGRGVLLAGGVVVDKVLRNFNPVPSLCKEFDCLCQLVVSKKSEKQVFFIKKYYLPVNLSIQLRSLSGFGDYSSS